MQLRRIGLGLALLVGAFGVDIVFAQNTNSSEGDRQALMDLYQSTNGGQWKNKTGWSANSMDLSKEIWGVGVEEINGELRVVHIDLQRGTKEQPDPLSDPADVLPGNNVEGQLPTSLGNLTEIRYFNIKQNKFSGTIPSSLQNWSKAQRILLGGHTREPAVGEYNHPSSGALSGGKTIFTTNKFSGNLPDIFGNMESLEVLESQYHGRITRSTIDPDNGYTGTIPNNWPSSLQMLFLGGNHFEGGIPLGLTTTDVSILHLQYNELSGSLLPELGNLTGMTHLRLYENSFSGSIPTEWEGFEHLELFHLADNSLSGSFPDFFFREGRNRFLHTFRLEFNNFDGELPDDINASDYPHLGVLGLAWNSFSGPIPNWIPQLKLIQHNLDRNEFSGDLPVGYHDSDSRLYKRLRNLRLNHNNLTGSIPQANPGPDLYLFYLHNNNFSGGISEDLGETETTRDAKIKLQNNKLSGEVPVNLINIKNLSELNLSGNKFSSSDLASIKNIINSSVDFSYGNQDLESGSDSGDEEGDEVSGGIPDLYAPAHQSEEITLTPSFEWSDVGADYYVLHYSSEHSTEQSVVDVTVKDNSYTVSEALNPETTYEWRVRGVKDGVEGEWSELQMFETGTEEDFVFVPAPKPLSPENDAEDNTYIPTFTWTAVKGADYYILHSNRTNPGKMVIDAEVTGTYYTPEEPLEPETEYHWRVRAVTNGVEGEWSEIWEFTTTPDEGATTTATDPEGVPVETGLAQNYPNPFNPATQIEFTLSELQNVSLRVYDTAGRQVVVLVDGLKQAGRHTVTFSAENLANGVYFYRFITESNVYTRKMTLVK